MSETGTLGRYRLGEVIGAGGMGTVVRASDEVLGRQVALKLLREDLARDDRALARFRQEARIAASLSHPGIAAVYDFAEEEGRQAIVMELLDGEDLHSLLQRDGALDPAVVAGLLAEAADALAYAHRLGAVHRDVKPANIFLTRSGTVKITDFGIAFAGGAGQLTTTGALIGTPDFLSPEQVRGERATGASDLYSLGCVGFELLTGRPPFIGDNSIAVATARLDAPAPSPRALNPAVSEALDAVIRCALDPDPDRRFASAAAMATALRSAVAPLAPPGGSATGSVATSETQRLGLSPATLVDVPAGGQAAALPPVVGRGRNEARVGPPPGSRPASPRRGHSRWVWLWLPVMVILMAGISYDIVTAWQKANARHAVPSWSGVPFSTASAAAAHLGLHVRRVDDSSEATAGTVLGSTPAAGTLVKRGQTITLAVSLGNLFPEPNVVNQMQAQAIAALQAQGLHPVVSDQTVPGSVDQQVASQDPPASTAVAKGATVTLTVTAADQGQGSQGDTSSACSPLLDPLFAVFGNPCASPAPAPGPNPHGHGGNG